MPTPSQLVDQQINDEHQRYLNSVYSGKVPIPDNIIELMIKGYLILPPQFHKFSARKIKVIASKSIGQLTNDDINHVITIVVNTSLNNFFEDFEEAIEHQIKLEKFVLAFNENVHEFQQNLNLKKANLLALSGARNNGLKIIN